MRLLEFITGSRKKCHACHEAFSVEPLACPKCGAKVKTHKAEKWGAAIAVFVGLIEWFCRNIDSILLAKGKKVYDMASESELNELLKSIFEKEVERKGLIRVLAEYKYGEALWLIQDVIEWALVGFIITLVIKKIVLAVRAKKARQEG